MNNKNGYHRKVDMEASFVNNKNGYHRKVDMETFFDSAANNSFQSDWTKNVP